MSIPPENIRKSELFSHFQRVKKWNIGLKWVKFNFCLHELQQVYEMFLIRVNMFKSI